VSSLANSDDFSVEPILHASRRRSRVCPTGFATHYRFLLQGKPAAAPSSRMSSSVEAAVAIWIHDVVRNLLSRLRLKPHLLFFLHRWHLGAYVHCRRHVPVPAIFSSSREPLYPCSLLCAIGDRLGRCPSLLEPVHHQPLHSARERQQ
jgi:hypothetical protein